jgi:16S rRNA processing protein RimM
VEELLQMELVAIGKILRPIGTQGDVKILPFAESPERFLSLNSVWIGKDQQTALSFKLEQCLLEMDTVRMHISSISTREDARTLCDQFVFVAESEKALLQVGRYYIDDILGCEVELENKGTIGTVRDVLNLPANDVWLVWNGEKEIMIPAVKAIVKSIKIEQKRITLFALDGLTE